MKKIYLLLLLASLIAADPELYFIEPEDGKTYTTEVAVKFGLKDFGIAPAGYNIPNTGHHHLIINAELPDLNLPIPANENYMHFGLGQTETTLRLEPGTYSLQLLMGNYLHIPHEQPLLSKVISITVE
tara:strand:- start:2087 stop:2470 length:384 start_codon:yes stop_codon:yes gene_type:complete